jgi:hypothetical protein
MKCPARHGQRLTLLLDIRKVHAPISLEIADLTQVSPFLYLNVTILLVRLDSLLCFRLVTATVTLNTTQQVKV